jgi:hypothetical protein
MTESDGGSSSASSSLTDAIGIGTLTRLVPRELVDVQFPATRPVLPHLHDLLLQVRISNFPHRRLGLALLRVVIRRHGKFQDRTDRFDAKLVPVRVNELD